MSSPLLASHQSRGARMGELGGVAVPRSFGDPAAEYLALREAAGVADRADLGVLRMWGKDPVRMLQGLLTNDLTGAPPGQGVYAAMLTPKGRMVADLRAFTRATAEGPEVWVIVAREALAGVREHLGKYVPPMFARWADESDARGVLGVYGPQAREVVSRTIGTELPDMPLDGFAEPVREGEPLLVTRTDFAGADGFEIVAPAGALPGLWDALLEGGATAGARPVGQGALHTLRVESGKPRYGTDLTAETIPTEAYQSAGLLDRAISFTKGCYTGQEVIVRIAHRGHVNRHLRGVLLHDAPVPANHTPLFHPETGKEIGWTTSAAVSPKMRQTVALAYVRREVEPGGSVRVGTVGGSEAEVVEVPFEV
jgi:folate-binding protein YgfZ